MKKNASKSGPKLLQHDQHFLDQGFKSLAGVDEAGRGPLAGPVVASAVIVRDFLFSSDINDSKKMTPKAREIAYEEILEKSVVGIGVIDSPLIDEINIFEATMRAMQEALTRLGEIPDCVLIDGPKAPKLPFKQIPIINGDAVSFSIACASVVAKVTRDRIMKYYDRIYPEYGFGRHKGYGTQEHVEALKKHGPCKIHRRSFEPVKSLCKLF
ncbi:MAG: ribonuclease HII [Omnitrophica bacterium RIFCSPHIGHO2_02_FULL_51_18]|nr:MAG: ribonuclease HII [Omnitrophica bacterium RIFCSPHIGHO2_02_FULL_51_18]